MIQIIFMGKLCPDQSNAIYAVSKHRKYFMK